MKNYSADQFSASDRNFGQILHHQYGIFVDESQTFLPREMSLSGDEQGETSAVCRLIMKSHLGTSDDSSTLP